MTTVESSAFFLREQRTGNEVIVFGDVEPDSVSLEPHNKRVWETAASKVAVGSLRAIFIECSYNDDIDDAYLYGHLCPRHLVAELSVLASKVMEIRESSPDRKRKRAETISQGPETGQLSPRSPRTKRNTSAPGRDQKSGDFVEPRTRGTPRDIVDLADMIKEQSTPPGGDKPDPLPGLELINPSRWADADPLPLTGMTVYIIHIKETLTDGPAPGERILRELRAHAEEAHLGCEFVIPTPAEGIWI